MKNVSLLLSLLLLCTVSFAAETNIQNISPQEAIESVQRAADANIKMLSETIRELKSKNSNKKLSSLQNGNFLESLISPSRECDDDDNKPDPVRCVPNCTWRRSDGSCISYGPDFCGPNASCTENCTWRRSDGSCIDYGPDICN
ncbi:MAG: hypothetical protein AABY53_08765 [Bdellovibrionota bacterium]